AGQVLLLLAGADPAAGVVDDVVDGSATAAAERDRHHVVELHVRRVRRGDRVRGLHARVREQAVDAEAVGVEVGDGGVDVERDVAVRGTVHPGGLAGRVV